MVKTDVLLSRMRKLDEYLGILQRMQRYSQEEFLADPERYGAAERFLQLTIECLNDMGNHVIADENLGTVNCCRDIPTILRKEALVSSGDEAVWVQMIGFRNALVHDYLTIDREIVYRILTQNLNDFKKIQQSLGKLL